MISTHAPHTRRDLDEHNRRFICSISTHAPHTRRDQNLSAVFSSEARRQPNYPYAAATKDFYSRASYEARLSRKRFIYWVQEFLLTRLIRGATMMLKSLQMNCLFLLTRLIRGATQEPAPKLTKTEFLLTRLIRGATGNAKIISNFLQFLLTRLIRGATSKPKTAKSSLQISTHAPHTRRDGSDTPILYVANDFYSRASYEARPVEYLEAL